MFLPVLEYGDILLTGTVLANKKRLQTLQNKGLRCALRRDITTSTVDLHEEAGLLKLKDMQNQHLINFMYDMASNVENLRQPKLEGVNTNSSNKKILKVKRPKTECFKKCLAYLGPKVWNALPDHLHHITVKSVFKTQVRLMVEKRAATALETPNLGISGIG